MKKMRVLINEKKERSYDIFVEHGILRRIGRYIRPLGLGKRIFLLTSPTIGALYLKSLVRGLRSAGCRDIQVNYLPDGEKNKSFAWYQKLTRRIARMNKDHDEKVFVVNLGGGVVGDMGGFVAATYRRGVAYVQVPTTLLGFVDCGIGGKVGVNSEGIKNIIGAFHQPRMVCGDLDVLETLKKREMRSGLAEVVKYGVIESSSLFAFVESNIDRIFSLERDAIQRIVAECYSIKARLVREDEFDTKDIRTTLNYGHTIGHAVESASQYFYRHGEAVALGMVCANDIAIRLRLLNRSVGVRVENLLIRIGLPVRMKIRSVAKIMHYFWRDKKFVNGKNKFIFATNIGRTRIVQNVPTHIVESAIRNRFFN